MPALSNVALTDTFDTWRVRTNQLIIKTNDDELATIASFNKANSANILAYNTGIGANAYLLTTIAGANTAVGDGANAYSNLITTGANTYLKSIIMGANTAVGIGANSFAIATIAGANTDVGTGANAFTSATIAGANTAVGIGANSFAIATISGANTAVGTGANAFTSATITGANNISIASFSKANGALANSSGISFNGNLNFPNGNVGIGTSTPTSKLHVVGSANITGNILLTGGIAPTANGSYGTAGQVLTSNGSAVYWGTMAASGIRSVQAFTSSGTWTKPTGVTKIIVFATGGGGGGGAVVEGTSGGGGGGAGGTGIKFLDVTSISSETVTIGAGGNADANGTNTTFGTHITAVGGRRGFKYIGSWTGMPYNGQGGTAIGGDLNITGGSGTPFEDYNAGTGGASFWGGGTGGNMSFNIEYKVNAEAYGSGATGQAAAGESTGPAAGRGANGVVFILEF